MNQAEIGIMKERIQYFSDKKINDLTNSEIEEFLAIREYVRENHIKPIWDAIGGAMKGYKEKLGINK
ncbi:hypothetical protein [Salimicrobium album]|uniref:Uncharacterized protein n=1 Tax=Salimicrobium album TaxID=50717 RepID=A0A1H3D6Z5_9BACI|nr:hypothetical protein [Salimicrobium album]SDX62145.1 hypothetical protein SAMN04488081_0854 [Salimicrobium album]